MPNLGELTSQAQTLGQMQVDSLTYVQKVRKLFGSALIGYWPLNEPAGAALALDYSGNNRHAPYTNCTPGSTAGPKGGLAALFDGVSSYVNLIAAPGLAAAWSGTAGSMVAWGKVRNAAVWTDASGDDLLRVQAPTGYAAMNKTAAGNTLRGQILMGGDSDNATAAYNDLGWFMTSLSWSDAADQMKFYLNSAQQGGTQTPIGTWAAGVPTTMLIGASTTVPATPWNGWLAQVMLINKVLTLDDVIALYT